MICTKTRVKKSREQVHTSSPVQLFSDANGAGRDGASDTLFPQSSTRFTIEDGVYPQSLQLPHFNVKGKQLSLVTNKILHFLVKQTLLTPPAIVNYTIRQNSSSTNTVFQCINSGFQSLQSSVSFSFTQTLQSSIEVTPL